MHPLSTPPSLHWSVLHRSPPFSIVHAPKRLNGTRRPFGLVLSPYFGAPASSLVDLYCGIPLLFMETSRFRCKFRCGVLCAFIAGHLASVQLLLMLHSLPWFSSLLLVAVRGVSSRSASKLSSPYILFSFLAGEPRTQCSRPFIWYWTILVVLRLCLVGPPIVFGWKRTRSN